MTDSQAKRPRDLLLTSSWAVVCVLVPIVAVSMAARDPGSKQVVFVPRAEIPAYHTLERRDLRMAERSGDAVRGAATRASEIVGTIATRDLRAGRPVPERALVRRPPGLPAWPVAVDLRNPTVIGGPVNPGDRVLVARRPAAGGRQVVAPLALVLDAAPRRLMLAMSPEQWAKVADDSASWIVVRRL